MRPQSRLYVLARPVSEFVVPNWTAVRRQWPKVSGVLVESTA